MLVLSRKVNERILIGDDIEITVLKTSGGRVKLGISADAFVSIRRAEVQTEEDGPQTLPMREIAVAAESA
ncbi:MAG: carbon storage regulator [Rubinisphaera brasiliensis]|uniref:Translational regulator CsrA n=1 Tax=Rubinisphaera brasiliensis (strain ATCC 49424 / DSM 5305 / JCM 21570 / IAM 15109 / NBRC 103401 / IFAM 1448) TaxID=756272 RepID=F0SRM0_RUBBR|nr:MULTISPECIES: carbon storage regulator [Rubinisphaera]ADY59143.1 carbon storage regulator [Rubinisphaera brasiliensis DSM 5305]MBB02154.1 carbon storage regulator [Planctomyces sp.]